MFIIFLMQYLILYLLTLATNKELTIKTNINKIVWHKSVGVSYVHTQFNSMPSIKTIYSHQRSVFIERLRWCPWPCVQCLGMLDTMYIQHRKLRSDSCNNVSSYLTSEIVCTTFSFFE